MITFYECFFFEECFHVREFEQIIANEKISINFLECFISGVGIVRESEKASKEGSSCT